MQIKIFDIPIGASDGQKEELNHFLRANRIVDIRKELAQNDGNSCWTFCITYLPPALPTRPEPAGHAGGGSGGGGKVDYKEVLAPDAFERFAAMRKVRKQIAESEAVPAYAVFTDAELSEVAKLPEVTLAAMLSIPGIGKKKVEKYGAHFLPQPDDTTYADEARRLFDGRDREP